MTAAGSIIAAAGLVPLIYGLDVWLRRLGLIAFVDRHSASGRFASANAAASHPHLAERAPGGRRRRHPGCAGRRRDRRGAADRWRWLYLLAIIAAAPARIPFSVGHTDANLLVPLYLVIAAGALATAWELIRGTDAIRTTGWIGMAFAAFLGWSAISMIWTADIKHGGVEMFFFYLPFGLMIARLGQLALTRRDLRYGLIVQTALAVVFATVALWQEATHHVFWNPGIEVENTYKSFFRVNSLFWDASIYARFMAVSLILLAGVAIHRRASPWLLALMAYLFLGMYVELLAIRISGPGGRRAWRSGRASGRGASRWASSPPPAVAGWSPWSWRCRGRVPSGSPRGGCACGSSPGT